MATIGNTFPTLVDEAKRTDPNGSTSQIAEVLAKFLPILEDMAWQEGNLPTGHRYTSRTSLPSVGAGLTWRRLNQGVDPGKSTTEQFDETCGMLEGYSKVDVDLAKLNGNEASFRLSEDKAFLQAFNIEVARALFYESASAPFQRPGDAAVSAGAPERITGLTPRLNVIAGNADPSALQIINADSSASAAANTSIWLIGWSPETVFGIYPKGSQAGIIHEDLGRQLTLEPNQAAGSTRQFLALVTRWQWKMGLCVRDYRFICRIANLDLARVAAATFASGVFTGGADIALSMLDAISKIFSMDGIRACFYMSRQTYNLLNRQLVMRQANWLEWVDRNGRRLPSFYGVPIIYVDSILNTEAKVA